MEWSGVRLASAKELRGSVDSSYEALAGAGHKWAAARPAAESVLRNEIEYALAVAEAMEVLRLPERKQFVLESKDAALAALTEVATTCQKVFSYVEDRDLGRRTPYLATIAGVLQAAAEQANGSAIVIKAAS